MTTILFVESDDILRNAIHRAFKAECNIKVTLVMDTKQAKEVLDEQFFDLLVIDTVLKYDDTDGITFLKNIRKEGIYIPACFYTPLSQEDVSEQMMGYNCLTVISNQIDPEGLVKIVKDMLYISGEDGQVKLDELEELAQSLETKVKKFSKQARNINCI